MLSRRFRRWPSIKLALNDSRVSDYPANNVGLRLVQYIRRSPKFEPVSHQRLLLACLFYVDVTAQILLCFYRSSEGYTVHTGI